MKTRWLASLATTTPTMLSHSVMNYNKATRKKTLSNWNAPKQMVDYFNKKQQKKNKLKQIFLYNGPNNKRRISKGRHSHL